MLDFLQQTAGKTVFIVLQDYTLIDEILLLNWEIEKHRCKISSFRDKLAQNVRQTNIHQAEKLMKLNTAHIHQLWFVLVLVNV